MNPWSHAPATLPGATDSVAPGALGARPAIGLLGVLIGTIAAVSLVPASEHYAPHALVPSALALAAGLLVGPALSSIRRPGSAFRAEHILLFGLVYWLLLDALQSLAQLWDVSRGAVQSTFLYIGLFAGSLWAGTALASLLGGRARVVAEAPDVGARFLFRAGLLCFVLGFAQSLLTCEFSPACVLNALHASRFEVPWFSGPGIKGLNQVLLHLKYFGYLLGPLLVALHARERRVSWRVAVLAPLTFLFLLLLLRDGGRRELGSVIGAAALTWILLRPQIRARHFAALLAAFAALLLLMQLIVTWRDVGVTRGFAMDAPAPKAYSGVVVDWDFEWMVHAVEVVPERAPAAGWDGIAYVLGYPIPRSVWTTKPPLHGIDLPRYLGREYGPGFSWNCSAVCDLYLIGGWFAIVVGGVLYGVLCNAASRLLFTPLSIRSRLLYAVIVMALFLTVRTLLEFMAQGMTVLGLAGLLAARDVLIRLSRPAS